MCRSGPIESYWRLQGVCCYEFAWDPVISDTCQSHCDDLNLMPAHTGRVLTLSRGETPEVGGGQQTSMDKHDSYLQMVGATAQSPRGLVLPALPQCHILGLLPQKQIILLLLPFRALVISPDQSAPEKSTPKVTLYLHN